MANTAWFGPRWDRHLPPRPFAGATLLELLLLCRVLRRTGAGGDRARWLTEAALPLAERAAAGPGGGEQTLVHRLWLSSLIADLGRPFPRSAVGLLERVRRHRHGGAEASPVYDLEARYVLDLAGTGARPASPEAFEAALAAHGEGHSEYDAYGITHAVLYATDMGALPPPPVPWRARPLADLVGTWVDRGHWDLVAELLLCRRAVGETPDETTHRAWAALAAARRTDGSLPGPPFDATVLAGRSGERADAYRFRTCYHTTLVAAMAAAAEEGRST